MRSIRARQPGPGSGCVPWSAAAASPGVRRRRRGGAGGGGKRRRHSSPRRPGLCTRALQRHGPVGAGRGIGVPTAANGGAFPQPTALPPGLPPSAALPASLADPTPRPAADRCRSAGRPPAPAADIRTVLWAVADTVRALAAEAAVGAKVLPADCLHNIYS
jgi:hypothetical protein